MLLVERLAVLLGLALLIVAAWGSLRLWRQARLRQLRATQPFAALVPPGMPTVVAFSTPGCAECRSRQAPALARLAQQRGPQVAVVTLSALEHPQLVARLGILTVPATVLLDASGSVRQINLGFASEQQLAAQIERWQAQQAASNATLSASTTHR
jgi:thiol-disulfide isomerase/thioredoxin